MDQAESKLDFDMVSKKNWNFLILAGGVSYGSIFYSEKKLKIHMLGLV